MFIYITPENRSAFVEELAAMHRLRKRVFYDRLGWDVQIVGDMEVDIYDALDTHYLVAMDPDGAQARMCVRFLPTTGLYMLADAFPILLHGAEPPRAESLWESSRFAVDLDHRSGGSHFGVSVEMCALLGAMNELALHKGWAEVITVTSVVIERLIKRAGYPLRRIGPAVSLGVTRGVAGFMAMTAGALSECLATSSLTGPLVRNLNRDGAVTHAA